METFEKADTKEDFVATLLASKKVSKDDIQKAVELQKAAGIRIGNALLRVGALSEDNLLNELSLYHSLPVARESSFPEPQALYRFMVSVELNFDWFMSKEVVIWEKRESNQIFFIARDVFDLSIFEVIRRFFPSKEIVPMLSANNVLEKALDDLKKEYRVESLFNDDESRLLRELAEEAPVVEFVNNIIAQAVDSNASDIHIEPEEDEFKIRFRVDGVLQERLSQPAERFSAVASRIKLISGLDISERRLPQDGRMTTRMGGLDMDLRVSTVPCVFGESLVLRILPKDRDEASLSLLGMETDHLVRMKAWAKLTSGILLVTGPTGSGKSTTLHAALSESNDGARKIITVEDPVEIRGEGITQIQTHEEIGYTFANALRAILRQDPDVIMIGEIRDLETAEIAIQAALSGHLVVSTLHTNDALSSFTRLIDMGIEPFLAAAPVKGVQAQRLVRCLCQKCSKAISEPEILSDQVIAQKRLPLGSNWRQAVGCSDCQMTGFSGRTGIYELIEVSTGMQELVAKGASINEIRAYSESHGFRTLFEDGLIKASHGKTTLEEILRVVNSEVNK